jgi:predicted membrane-bound spermidine synthase
MAHIGSSRGLVYGATLFLTALGTLLLEILLTRVLSVVMWYHFTFAVISISLLGIAAGAMACHRRCLSVPQGDDDQSVTILAKGLTLFSLAMTLPIALMTTVVGTPTFSVAGALLLLVYFAACMAPFYASGYVTAAIFRFGSDRISSLYAIDLFGASLGCLLSIPLLNYLGGIGSLLAVAVAMAAGAVLLSSGKPSKTFVAALVLLITLSGMLVVQFRSKGVDLRTVKLSLREELRPILEVKWNSHSRLAVLDYFDSSKKDSFPFLSWGLSDRYAGWLPRQYLITIDGASETPVTEFQTDLAKHEYLAWDITSLPYHLLQAPKALIIGAGGGRDVLTALRFGSKDVTAVELNQGIVDWVTERYADFAGHLYSRPDVRLVVDDGRNFVRSSRETYDVLQISMIDTFAATAAGAYTLAENNLYTAEAFDEYLNHLTEDGIFSMNRFFLDPPQQTLRVVTLAREALERRGVQEAVRHIVVIKKKSPLGDNGLVMVKKTPFAPAELTLLRTLYLDAAYEPIAVPGELLDNPFTRYLGEAEPERFYQSYSFDVRPPIDDRPFFFNTLKISNIASYLWRRQQVEAFRAYNLDAVFILFMLLGMAILALLAFVFLPLVRGVGRSQPMQSRDGIISGSNLLYFIWVGLGFILVEIVLIQRFHLYLGHPIYSLAVILVSLLAFSGLGSAWTRRWPHDHAKFQIIASCAAVTLVVIAFEALWSVFVDHTLGLPLSSRIALAVASLMPVGICMGMPYPLALRAISVEHSEAVPWIWAINAAASVLGSILAFSLAMAVGFRWVLLIGAACYACALLTAPRLLAHAGGRSVAPTPPGGAPVDGDR